MVRAAPPLDGLCYRDVRRELSVEMRVQLLERATKCTLRGCNLHSTRWQERFPRVHITNLHSGASRGAGGLQMVASRRRAELNGILACFPDGATIRITYPAAYCRLTPCVSDAQ
jgi:hypothetical protein